MALMKCKECEKEVSTEAKACPNCGWVVKAPNKLGCFQVVGIVFGLILILSICDNSDKKTSQAPDKTKTPQELRSERIEKSFSAWDGSHRDLTAFIKRSMNDPDSYNHIKTEYWDKGDYLIVKTTYRGKNAFGGVVVNWVKVKADLDGFIMEFISKGP